MKHFVVAAVGSVLCILGGGYAEHDLALACALSGIGGGLCGYLAWCAIKGRGLK
jgi:hypothetical protein